MIQFEKMNILDLPDEILQNIFSYIEQKQDVFNIIRVCKRFHYNLRQGLTTLNGIHPITIFQLKSFPRVKNCKCLIELIISESTLDKITDMKLNTIHLNCDNPVVFLKKNPQLKEFRVNSFWLLDGVYYTRDFTYIPKNVQKLYLNNRNINDFKHHIAYHDIDIKYALVKNIKLLYAINCFEIIEIENSYHGEIELSNYNQKFKYIIKLFYNPIHLINNLRHIIKKIPKEKLQEIKIDLISTIRYLQNEINMKKKELFEMNNTKWSLLFNGMDYDETFSLYEQLNEKLQKCIDIFKKYKKIYYYNSNINFIKHYKCEKYYEFDII